MFKFVSVSGTMAGAKTVTLQMVMESRMKSKQEHDEHIPKRMRQRSSMKNQKLEPKPPDSVPHKLSKPKCYKGEEPGRGKHSLKQPAANTLSRSHQTSLTLKSKVHSSYN